MSRARSAFAAAVVFASVFTVACDDDGAGPDGRDPLTYLGSYLLEPTPTLACVFGSFGSGTVSMDSIHVVDADEDSLYVRTTATMDAPVITDQHFEVEFSVALDADDEAFDGSTPIVVSFTDPITVNGTGSVAIDGEFTGDDTFAADLDASFNGTMTTAGGSSSITCSPVSLEVTGTK